MTEDELDAALAQQRLSNTRRLGEILVARGALSEADVSRALAEQHELPFVELSDYDIDLAAAALLPVDLARRHSALAVSYLPDGSVLVVVADPTSSIRDEELRASLGVPVQYAVAVAREIETAIASTVEAEPPTVADRPPVALVSVPEESDEEPERDDHAGSRDGHEPDTGRRPPRQDRARPCARGNRNPLRASIVRNGDQRASRRGTPRACDAAERRSASRTS